MLGAAREPGGALGELVALETALSEGARWWRGKDLQPVARDRLGVEQVGVGADLLGDLASRDRECLAAARTDGGDEVDELWVSLSHSV